MNRSGLVMRVKMTRLIRDLGTVLAPVSYKHLDVYKRQMVLMAEKGKRQLVPGLNKTEGMALQLVEATWAEKNNPDMRLEKLETEYPGCCWIL